eukprot:COSAG03_NODE_334_length_8910_cov_814.886392_2_plen_118_part_00
MLRMRVLVLVVGVGHRHPLVVVQMCTSDPVFTQSLHTIIMHRLTVYLVQLYLSRSRWPTYLGRSRTPLDLAACSRSGVWRRSLFQCQRSVNSNPPELSDNGGDGVRPVRRQTPERDL